MIFKGSRYENQPVVMITDADGVNHPTVFGAAPTMVNKFFYYQVKQGDRLDLIAHRFFQKSDLWWYIANANPEVFYPDNLTAGIILRIPSA